MLKITRIVLPFIIFATIAQADNQTLSSLLSHTQTLQGDFSQQQFNTNGAVLQESSGHFVISRPALLRWETKSPVYQLIISGEKDLQVYDSDLQQLTRYPKRQGIGITPAALLAGDYVSLQMNFKITDIVHQPRPTSCVAPQDKPSAAFCLQPKHKDDPLLAVTLSFDQGQPHTLYVRDQFKQTTIITLTHVKRNATVAASNFLFTPPAGTEIIKQMVT